MDQIVKQLVENIKKIKKRGLEKIRVTEYAPGTISSKSWTLADFLEQLWITFYTLYESLKKLESSPRLRNEGLEEQKCYHDANHVHRDVEALYGQVYGPTYKELFDHYAMEIKDKSSTTYNMYTNQIREDLQKLKVEIVTLHSTVCNDTRKKPHFVKLRRRFDSIRHAKSDDSFQSPKFIYKSCMQ